MNSRTVFAAAQTEDFVLLSDLCDPLGGNDGDTELICAITDDHADRDMFIETFARARLNGTAAISGDRAVVAFSFGPDGDEEETMVPIQREGKWYLYSY